MKEVLRLNHGVLTHFPAPSGRNKPALILCPGGGYEYCSIREGALLSVIGQSGWRPCFPP